jgi:hypothetical protein
MTLPSVERWNNRSKDELIWLVIEIFAENRRLQAEADALKKWAAISRYSSQPPSRDQKGNPPAGRRRRKRGAKPGYGSCPQ